MYCDCDPSRSCFAWLKKKFIKMMRRILQRERRVRILFKTGKRNPPYILIIGSSNMDIINLSRENILMFLAELFLFLEADTVLPPEIGIFRLSFLFCHTTSTNHLLALMELMFLWPLLQLGLMLMSWRVIFHVWLAW